MQIRTATELDIQSIAQMHAASWQIAYRGMLSDAYLDHQVERDRLALWQDRLAKPTPNQRVWVAEQEDKLIGFVCLYGTHDPQWGTLIDNLHVYQSYQRRGIGALLMKKAADWCCQVHPSQSVYLWVLQANLSAQAFYQCLGAHKVESDIWSAPDGKTVPLFRFAWPSLETLVNGVADIVPEAHSGTYSVSEEVR